MYRRLFFALAVISASFPLFGGNINGRVTCEGKPLEGVPVSDGVQIVKTDASGRYSLESGKEEGMVFVITPSGYIARSTDGLRPGFWQTLHLDSTQEETHDFVLEKQNQDNYRVIFTTDMHLSNDPRRNDLNRFREQVFPLICKEAAQVSCPVYTFNLGDFTHDLYWYRFDFDEADGLRFIQDLGYPTPMYTIMGNHDHDGAIVGENVDERAGWMQHDCWGPSSYSLNIGSEHWIFMDDIIYVNVEGKGKLSKGIKGDRSYNAGFTPAQMTWLEKDLSLVDSDTRVYICVHIPFFRAKQYVPDEQLSLIHQWCSRFTRDVEVFSGHSHLMNICDWEAYPRFHQYVLSATSGAMWETDVNKTLYSSDGSNSGLWIADFSRGGEPAYRFDTFNGGDSWMRFYDMNEVGKVYAASEGVKLQQEKFSGSRKDYSGKEYKNMVMLNYWGWHPGDKVEMFAAGKSLKVTANNWEDPVKNFVYDVPRLLDKEHNLGVKATDATDHMYVAKTSSSRTPVTVRVTAKDGTVRFEKTFSRPLVFEY